MRSLRECYAPARPAAPDPGPVEPVAILASVGRPEPVFAESIEFDRAFFGVDAETARAMGPDLPHLIEVVYEALELSGVQFGRLGALRIGWIHAGGDRPVDLTEASRLLGLDAVRTLLAGTGDGALCLATHQACLLLRAGDADLCIATARWDSGWGALVLARPDRASAEHWRVRGLVAGSASGALGDPRVVRDAHGRAGLGGQTLREGPSTGTRGLLQAVAWLEDGNDGLGFAVQGQVGDDQVRLVLGVPEQTAVSEAAPPFLALSARSLPSLAGLARATCDLGRTDTDLSSLATDAASRPAFEHRLAVPANGWLEAQARLEAWLDGQPGVLPSGYADDPGVVFVIPPAGAQRVGMGDRLYATEPAFRDALHRCDRATRSLLPRALLSVLYPGHDRDPDAIDDPLFANPLTFSLAWALAETYRGYGIEPIAVLGGGVGELCAAAIAGTVDVEQALKLAVERGRLLSETTETAAWAVLGATEEQVRGLLLGVDEVDVVALPAPGRVVVGGTPAAVRRVLDRAQRLGMKSASMSGGPGHSPLVDGVLADYGEAARTLSFDLTDLPVLSTVTGRRLARADAEHWVATLRAPLRLAGAMEAAWESGGRTFVELAARPTLVSAGRQTLQHQPARWLSALEPNVDDVRQLRENLAALWVRGARVQYQRARFPGGPSLPTYAFDRRPLEDEWLVERTDEVEAPQDLSAWLPPLADAEDTLVPDEERRSLRRDTVVPDAELPDPEDADTIESADLLDLEKVRPQVLTPMAFMPEVDDDQGMSVDSEPTLDITLDDPGSVRRFAPPRSEPDGDEDPTAGLMGQGGPVWSEVWRERAPRTDLPEFEPATFVVLADRIGIGDYVGTLLEQAGHRVIRAESQPGVERPDTVQILDPAAEDAWVEVLDAIGTVHGAVHVLHLWTLDDEDGADPARGWPGVVSLCQEILAQGLPAALHLVTRGAVRDVGGLRTDTEHPATVGAGLWGLAALLFAETGILGGIVDLEPEDEDPELLTQHLLHTLANPEPFGWWAIRGGRRWLRTVAPVEVVPNPPIVNTLGAWLLVGDIDALAVEVLAWLVAHGVKKAYLVSSSPPPPEVLKAVLEFQKRGAACVVVRADASDPKGAEQIRQRLSREKVLSGAIFRYAPTPRTLRDLVPRDDLPRWRTAVATAGLVAESLPPEAPTWAWSEGSPFDFAPGGGVGAAIAGSVGAVLLRRPKSALVHTGPHTTLGLVKMLDLFTGLAGRGGQWGVWVR